MNIKKSNVITAIICAVTLSTVSFYTGVSAASSSSVSYKSQGRIVFDNNTDDIADDVVFDASDFNTISDIVITGKKQIGTELNKYPSINLNLSSEVPDFAELANAVDILTDDTTDTTSDKILKDYTAYVKGNKIKGTIPSKAAATYTPGRSDQTIAAGQYLSGVQTIKGDSNLQAANIVSGKTIFGVTGSATAESHTIEANKSVTISNTSGSITPTSGNNAMAAVSYSVQGVDASKIVSGQSILGVSGTATGESHTVQSSKSVSPDFSSGNVTVSPDSGYNVMSGVTINKDSNLIAENIKDGVSIFGVTGSLNSSSVGTITYPNLTYKKIYSQTWNDFGTTDVTTSRGDKSHSYTTSNLSGVFIVAVGCSGDSGTKVNSSSVTGGTILQQEGNTYMVEVTGSTIQIDASIHYVTNATSDGKCSFNIIQIAKA